MDGNNPIALTEVAGCYDKIIGVEYEDCYFTTRIVSQDLISWLDASFDGNPNGLLRNFMLFRGNSPAQLTGQLEIKNAFLSEFSVSDLEASSSNLVTVRLVVVPGLISSVAPNATLGTQTTTPTLRRGSYRVNILGINGAFVTAVQGLHASWPKVLQPGVGSRRRFMPGQPAFDDIRMDVSTTGATAADLDLWASQAALGTATPRDGVIDYMNLSLTVVIRQVNLFDVFPASFPPFGNNVNRRTVTLNLGRFTMQ